MMQSEKIWEGMREIEKEHAFTEVSLFGNKREGDKH